MEKYGRLLMYMDRMSRTADNQKIACGNKNSDFQGFTGYSSHSSPLKELHSKIISKYTYLILQTIFRKMARTLII